MNEHTYMLEALAMQIMKAAHDDARRRRMAACARNEERPLCNDAPREYDRRHRFRERGAAVQQERRGGTA